METGDGLIYCRTAQTGSPDAYVTDFVISHSPHTAIDIFLIHPEGNFFCTMGVGSTVDNILVHPETNKV